MRIGIQLPEVEREIRWPEMAAIARAAEDSGFDSIWMGDHLLYRGGARSERGPWDVWTQLAALAAVIKRVRLGPLVAATAFHAPGTLARMAASVDEVSGGRLILGLGAGWNETEFTAFGFPFTETVSRFAESFEIVHGLLASRDAERRVILWNTVPTHPYLPGQPLSNRRPTRGEVTAGVVFAERLVDMLQPRLLVGVGRIAAETLGSRAVYVRHPAQSGATAFRLGMRALLAPGSS